MIDHKLLLKNIIYIFFPKRCFFCGNVIAPRRDECAECEKTVKRPEGELCLLCGRGKDRCICRGHRHFFSAVAAPYYYCGPARKCIWRFKFRNCREISERLGSEMAGTVRSAFHNEKIDAVTAVPMRPDSVRRRGYNQSELLAMKTAAELSVPYDGELLEKIYETKKQRDLKAYMRSGNIFGVFDAPHPERLSDKCILLCDDVLTTGATLNECAKMLILNGARRVICVTACVGINSITKNGENKKQTKNRKSNKSQRIDKS